MATTAWADGYRTLYHWQPFDEERLRPLIENNSLYCSSPQDFNDPWDCKPFFNTDILNDPRERSVHTAWAVDLCRRRTQMSGVDFAIMIFSLEHDVQKGTEIIRNLSNELINTIAQKHRVYCLGVDLQNQLMWAHYANKHKGICLEYGLSNEVMCFAQKCEYTSTFPLTKAYEDLEDVGLQMLLTKSDAWIYENEYRLITTESAFASDEDLLVSVNGFLKLPEGALKAIIVGCECDLDKVKNFVHAINPHLEIKQAFRVDNKYELQIS